MAQPSQTARALAGDSAPELADPNGEPYDEKSLVNMIIGGIAEISHEGTVRNLRAHLAKLDRPTLLSVIKQMFPDMR